MADYISREAAIEAAKHAWAKGLEPSQYLETIPAADVEPVSYVAIQRTTIDEYYGTWGVCPECGYNDNTVRAARCGGCGARLIWMMNNEVAENV